MIHGTRDAAVPYDQSVMMCARLRLTGNQCELYTVQDAPHGIGPREKEARGQGYKEKFRASRPGAHLPFLEVVTQ